MTRNRSRVGGVQKIGPANPWRTSVGRLPQWSMWAWLSTTASIWCGWNGKWALRCRASSRRPWCSPQSSSALWLPTSSWCIDPDTPPAGIFAPGQAPAPGAQASSAAIASAEAAIVFRIRTSLSVALPGLAGGLARKESRYA